jgi:hypothetical protein
MPPSSTSSSSSIRLWRKIFPAIYTGMYRRILLSFRYQNIPTMTTYEYQTIQLCVRIIGQLLSTCLVLDCSSDNNDADRVAVPSSVKTLYITETIKHIQELKSHQICDTMDRRPVNHQTVQTTNSRNLISMISSLSNYDDATKLFLQQQVLQRIPSTLRILIDTLTSSKQGSIRQMVLSLNHVILIETSCCCDIMDCRFDHR